MVNDIIVTMNRLGAEQLEATGMTGAEASAEAMRQIGPGVVPVFPITPQTPIIEKFAAFAASGRVKSEMITVESEHSALSAAVGAAAAGSRAMTATSSAGLALMYEILGVVSGMRLPIVMNVVNRALSSPINIHCDHSDTMGVRDCGWIQLYSESAQEAYDHTILAIRLAEQSTVLLPTMVMQDGFITSHLLEKVETLSDEKVQNFVGEYKYPHSFFDQTSKDVLQYSSTFGPLMLPDYFFETKISQYQAMENAREIYKKIASELTKITERDYPEVESFQVDKYTEAVVIVMSSGAGTAKETAKKLNAKGHKVGVIKVSLFRPFPYKELGAVIKDIPNIAVLDRAFSFGSAAPLFTEVSQTVFKLGINDSILHCYVFGLGGRDLREKDVEQVYADLLSGNSSREVKFLNSNI